MIDFYSVSELRLPPNPLHYLKAAGELDGATKDQIDKGKALFTSAGCATCHVPENARHPFTDGLDHGPGADWVQRFVDAYRNDPRVLNTIGEFPQTMLQGLSSSKPDKTVNVHSNPLDYFIPFCFDVTTCFQFDDPLAAAKQSAEESRRLDLIIRVNLADPDRQFIPGNVLGQAKVNTPSLRGVWTQANLLHSGLAHTVAEAILAPGHPALRDGENGFAADESGGFNTHGATKDMAKSDVEALIRYVENIE